MADSGVAGYFGGGNDGGGNLSSIDKIALPADTKTTLSATLTSARRAMGGVSSSGTAGYFGGGLTSLSNNNIDKIAFPSDTKSALTATLSNLIRAMASYSNEGQF